MINVTKTYLPVRERFDFYVDKIFDNHWLTNDGPLSLLLEERLADYLGVENLVLVSNGGMALQIAYKLLGVSGEVITTPFSYVATTSTLVWDNLRPVFSDIDASLNLDPSLIEAKITASTSALVPVHTFGTPCDIEALLSIAEKHQLKLIFDAAHCFGTKYKGTSILNYGDASALSFHATKLFHSVEGGALVFKDDALLDKAKQLRNYGFLEGEILGLGINGRMNEFSAAMGLAVLENIDNIMERRQVIWHRYYASLSEHMTMQSINNDTQFNHQYAPVIAHDAAQRATLERSLSEKGIYPRRYFHPSLDTLSYLRDAKPCPVSQEIADKILCLPIYPDLTDDEQALIINTILKNL